MKKNQEVLLLAIENENEVIDQLTLNEELPLIGDDPNQDGDNLKSIPVDHLPWHQRPSVYWLLGPFALSALAFGGVIVPKVNLVLKLICHDYLRGESHHDPQAIFALEPEDQCRNPAVQSRVATFKLLMSLISGTLAAIVSPRLGAWSDRYGRIPMIVIVNSGMIVNEFITILAATFPRVVSVWWLLVGSIFDGAAGSFVATMALSHSYAADCTPSNKRNVVFGYFHGCLYTGIAAGPVLSGYIINITNNVVTIFYLALGCHILFVLMLIFVIPESIPRSRQLIARQKHRETASGSRSLPWFTKLHSFNILQPLVILYGPNESATLRRNLILLASTDTIVFGLGMGASTIVLLYSNYVFGWDTWGQSQFTSIVNSCKVSCLLVILPTVTHWYRKRQARSSHVQSPTENDNEPNGTDIFELTIIRIAIFADVMGFLSYAISPTGSLFTLSGAITSIGGTASPTMQAALTKHVPKENVGQLLGAMGLLHSLGRAIGPFVFTGIYAATVGFFPQTYFLILAVCFGMAWGMSWFIRPGSEYFSGRNGTMLLLMLFIFAVTQQKPEVARPGTGYGTLHDSDHEG